MISPDIGLTTSASEVVKGRAQGNRVAVDISNKAAARWAGLTARVSVPYGSAGLMTDTGEPVRVEYQKAGDGGAVSMKPGPGPRGEACWVISPPGVALEPGRSLTLTVADFSAIPCEDTGSSIRLVVSVKGQPDLCDVRIDVRPGATNAPAIQYFDASPDFVLHAGSETVRLSCFATNADTAILYRNNVKIGEQRINGKEPVTFEDRPSFSSVYKLEAQADSGSAWAQTSVHLAQTGWNRQTMQQGYPTLLLANASGDRLFGVFVNAATEAASLWSSATGFVGWEPESGDVFPQEMAASPGVFFDSALWLIGGSSVDTDVTSKEVYRFDLSGTGRTWTRGPALPADFTPRMGHACVVFQGEIWVLGGFTGVNGVAMRDMWSYHPAKGWRKRGDAAWSARCMLSAAVTAAGTVTAAETLWVYGGFDNPIVLTPKEGLWSSEDGTTWNDQTAFAMRPDPGLVRGATLLFNTLDKHLILAGSFLQRETKVGALGKPVQVGAGRLGAHIFTLHPDRWVWEDNPVSWGWEQFGGDPFLIRSLVFNGFLFFWSIYRNIEEPPKLNIFIPS